MNNDIFEDNYTNIVEPKYGGKRDPAADVILTRDIYNPHAYSIDSTERVDMTSVNAYSIDPVGCKDADDAFSIFTENDKLFLAIHIADPTEFIDLNSDLWLDIVSRTTTKYPSNRPPIHMMPEQVLHLSSLQGSPQGDIKYAITVLTEIDSTSFHPINQIKLQFSTILVIKYNAFSYSRASLLRNVLDPFIWGLKISEALKASRSLKTDAFKLNEISSAYPVFQDDYVYLYQDSPDELLMKQMIAEFAIFANSFVGEYIKINLTTGIFRTCNANHLLSLYNNLHGLSGDQLLQHIITNGIRADYMIHVDSHDLVGTPEYCHFTSPIRRLSDCVCHYLLKYIFFKHTLRRPLLSFPFSDATLLQITNRCSHISRAQKKIQYLDIKFRLLQVMKNILFYTNTHIHIQYYITGYTRSFLNIIICRINDFPVQMSYTLLLPSYSKQIFPKIIHSLFISHVNCFTRFDTHTLPELDHALGPP